MTDQQPTSHDKPYTPYDATYPRIQKKHPNTQEYVLQRERLEVPQSYYLGLGAFVQFALEAFPVLYPHYCIPDSKDTEGEHLLELFLHAYYGKRFVIGSTIFQAKDDIGIQRGMPQWAIR